MTEVLHGSGDYDQISIAFLISALLVAPFLEELAFRYPLKDFQKNFMPSMIAIFLLMVLSLFNSAFVGYVLLVLAIVYSANWILLKYGRISRSHSTKLNYLLSMSCFVVAHFGILEVVRFEYWPIYVIYAVHMGIAAYFLSKVRLGKNVYFGMFLHFLYNLVPVIVLVF